MRYTGVKGIHTGSNTPPLQPPPWLQRRGGARATPPSPVRRGGSPTRELVVFEHSRPPAAAIEGIYAHDRGGTNPRHITFFM
jgi:hypothetical protein